MSELSCIMEKHANPRIWRENHGEWVEKKRQQFPSRLALPYPMKSWTQSSKRQNLQKSAVTNEYMANVDHVVQMDANYIGYWVGN